MGKQRVKSKPAVEHSDAARMRAPNLDVPNTTYGLDADAIRAFRAETSKHLKEADPNNADQLHRVLDWILDLRAHADGKSDGDNAQYARELGASLMQGALGWTRRTTPQLAKTVAELEVHPPRWRLEVMMNLAECTSLLPDWLTSSLDRALEELNEGTGNTPALLAAQGKDGDHGSNPSAKKHLEKKLLCWLHYEIGRGNPAGKARKALADRLCLSQQAIDKWESGWKKSDALAERNLTECKERGRLGQTFGDDVSFDDVIKAWKAAYDPPKRSPTKCGE